MELQLETGLRPEDVSLLETVIKSTQRRFEVRGPTVRSALQSVHLLYSSFTSDAANFGFGGV